MKIGIEDFWNTDDSKIKMEVSKDTVTMVYSNARQEYFQGLFRLENSIENGVPTRTWRQADGDLGYDKISEKTWQRVWVLHDLVEFP